MLKPYYISDIQTKVWIQFFLSFKQPGEGLVFRKKLKQLTNSNSNSKGYTKKFKFSYKNCNKFKDFSGSFMACLKINCLQRKLLLYISYNHPFDQP